MRLISKDSVKGLVTIYWSWVSKHEVVKEILEKII